MNNAVKVGDKDLTGQYEVVSVGEDYVHVADGKGFLAVPMLHWLNYCHEAPKGERVVE